MLSTDRRPSPVESACLNLTTLHSANFTTWSWPKERQGREKKKKENPRQAGLEQRTVAQDMDMFMKLRNETRLCRPLEELCASLQDTCLPKVPTYLLMGYCPGYSG